MKWQPEKWEKKKSKYLKILDTSIMHVWHNTEWMVVCTQVWLIDVACPTMQGINKAVCIFR